MLKFIHAADLHLDSPLRGLRGDEGAPVETARTATRRALEKLVQLAVQEEVDFVLVAGDCYDGDWRDFNTGLFFIRQMTYLREAKIPVVLVKGNHDAASVITRSLPLPENVKWLSETEPETFVLELEDLPVAIHGQSFARGAISANLAAGYPSPLPGCFNIGMLHTSLDGRAGHDTYAPCSLRDLQSKGYDYWALGHVHSREVMSEDPWIVFSGNTQGRHVREGGAKGCTLVTVEGGRVEGVEPRELDVLRWAVCTVDVSGLHTSSEVVDRAVGVIEEQMAQNDGYEMAIRLELTGPCEAHNSIAGDLEQTRSDLRATVTDVSGGLIWIEDVRLRTEPPSRLTKEQTDALSRLTLAVEDLDVKDLVEASALWQRLPQQLRNNPDSFDFEELKKLAQAELVERLRREGSQR